MLERLDLTNFRTHRNLSVSFTPGVNVIAGPNNAGKTTILRAIRHQCFHYKASRERTITAGEKDGSVVLTFNGGSITRRIAATKSEIEMPDGTLITQPTPDTIDTLKKTLTPSGLGPLILPTGNEWWPQFHSVGDMFLVGDTPTEVKRLLSALGHIDIYEKARDVCRSRRDKLTAHMKVLRSDLDSNKGTHTAKSALLDALTPLRDEATSIEREIRQLRQSMASIKQVGESLQDTLASMISDADEQVATDLLADLAATAPDVEATNQQYQTLKRVAQPLPAILAALEATHPDQVEGALNAVRTDQEAYTAFKRVAQPLPAILAALEATHPDQVEGALNAVRTDQEAYTALAEEYHRVKSVYDALHRLEGEIESAQESVTHQEKELEAARADALAGGVCPILGGKCPRWSG